MLSWKAVFAAFLKAKGDIVEINFERLGTTLDLDINGSRFLATSPQVLEGSMEELEGLKLKSGRRVGVALSEDISVYDDNDIQSLISSDVDGLLISIKVLGKTIMKVKYKNVKIGGEDAREDIKSNTGNTKS